MGWIVLLIVCASVSYLGWRPTLQATGLYKPKKFIIPLPPVSTVPTQIRHTFTLWRHFFLFINLLLLFVLLLCSCVGHVIYLSLFKAVFIKLWPLEGRKTSWQMCSHHISNISPSFNGKQLRAYIRRISIHWDSGLFPLDECQPSSIYSPFCSVLVSTTSVCCAQCGRLRDDFIGNGRGVWRACQMCPKKAGEASADVILCQHQK